MLNAVEQPDLFDISGAAQPQPITPEAIYKQPTATAAIKLSIQVSGRDEKEIYMALDIDKGQWSRIISGNAHFPQDKYEQFMELVGNDVFLIWLAYRRGKGLHDLEDAKDKTIREVRAENADLRREIETLVKYGVLNGARK